MIDKGPASWKLGSRADGGSDFASLEELAPTSTESLDSVAVPLYEPYDPKLDDDKPIPGTNVTPREIVEYMQEISSWTEVENGQVVRYSYGASPNEHRPRAVPPQRSAEVELLVQEAHEKAKQYLDSLRGQDSDC